MKAGPLHRNVNVRLTRGLRQCLSQDAVIGTSHHQLVAIDRVTRQMDDALTGRVRCRNRFEQDAQSGTGN